MRWLVLVVLVACSGSPRTAPPSAAFTPTQFTVKVSGHGRPVILIPGLGCPGAVWDETVAHLGAGYETHTITMAGFAGQPAVAGASIANTRAELARYIRDRKLARPIVIGHSLGGFLAIWLAETDPDVVGPIVVVDEPLFVPAAFDPNVVVETDRAETAAYRDKMLGLPRAEFDQKMRTMFSGMTAKLDRLEPTIAAMTRSDQRTVIDEMYELLTTDLRPDVGKIRVPALVVFADGPTPGATKQAELITDHEVKVIPNAKHFVMTDEPAAFFAVLDDFLARHPAR